jgi:D-inositol-3-phosphate glycosyltransferase
LYGADPRRVSIVPPGVDLDVFTPGDRRQARNALGLDPHGRLLLFVGRIQPLKAPDLLVRAASVLLDRHPDWQDGLTIGILGGPSGSGLARPHGLQDLVADLGLQTNVRFVPPMDRATLAQWYRAADVLAVPSYNESFGLVAVEAQACGTPVVAAAVGGLPTAVGPGGLLVDGHDVRDWADTLEGLLLDPARRAALARRGMAHASGLGWDATTQGLLRAYGDARRRHSPSPITDALLLDGIPAAVIP